MTDLTKTKLIEENKKLREQLDRATELAHQWIPKEEICPFLIVGGGERECRAAENDYKDWEGDCRICIDKYIKEGK